MKHPKWLQVEGNQCMVIDDMGYQHSRGVYAKMVIHENRRRVAIADTRRGAWTFAKPLVIVGPPATGQETGKPLDAKPKS